jgi:hypothetical protein
VTMSIGYTYHIIQQIDTSGYIHTQPIACNIDTMPRTHAFLHVPKTIRVVKNTTL